MNCEEIRSLLAAWLDGELTQNASLVVETHLAACAECGRIAAEYREMQQTFHAEATAQSAEFMPTLEETSLWQNIQQQIQTEESAALREELEQMRQMVYALQREVGELRRQVNNPRNNSLQREISRFDVLMPGTPLNQSTNLRSLL